MVQKSQDLSNACKMPFYWAVIFFSKQSQTSTPRSGKDKANSKEMPCLLLLWKGKVRISLYALYSMCGSNYSLTVTVTVPLSLPEDSTLTVDLPAWEKVISALYEPWPFLTVPPVTDQVYLASLTNLVLYITVAPFLAVVLPIIPHLFTAVVGTKLLVFSQATRSSAIAKINVIFFIVKYIKKVIKIKLVNIPPNFALDLIKVTVVFGHIIIEIYFCLWVGPAVYKVYVIEKARYRCQFG